MRLSSRPNVEKLKARADVYGMIRSLGYQHDESVRQAALAALVEIGNSAINPLVESLGDVRLRDGVVKALVRIGAAAINPLILALRDQNAGVRIAASDALAQIGMLAVDPLIVVLRHKSWSVREASVNALVQIGKLAEDPLVALFVDKDERTEARHAAAEALMRLGVIDPLLTTLQSESGDIRRVIAEVVARSGDERWVGPLIAVLRDEAAAVRRSVALALGKLGDNRAVDPLVAALKRERDENARVAMTEALGELGWQAPKPKEESEFQLPKMPKVDRRETPQPVIAPAYGWNKVREILPQLKAVKLKPLQELTQMSPPNSRVRAFRQIADVIRDLQTEFDNYSRFRDLRFSDTFIKLIFDDYAEMGTEIVPATRQLEVTVMMDGGRFVVFYNSTFLATSGWDRILDAIPKLRPAMREDIRQLRAVNSGTRVFSEPTRVIQDLQFTADSYPRLKNVKYEDALIHLTFDNYSHRGENVVPATKQLEAVVVTDGTQFFVFYTASFLELW